MCTDTLRKGGWKRLRNSTVHHYLHQETNMLLEPAVAKSDVEELWIIKKEKKRKKKAQPRLVFMNYSRNTKAFQEVNVPVMMSDF